MKKTIYFGCFMICALILMTASGVQAAPPPFPDIPDGNKFQKIVEELHAKGIIIGYPDGQFKGQRITTRYEFAMAVKRAIDNLPKNLTGGGGKGEKGDTGEAGQKGEKGDKGDQGEPASREDYDKFINLITAFEKELKGMGVDVNAAKSKITDLANNVSAINRRIDRMPNISGSIFYGVRSDRSRFGFFDYSGAARAANPSSIFDNVTTVNDFHLGITANLPGNVKFNGDLVSSNYLAYRGGNLSNFAAALPNTGLSQQNTLYQANLVIPIGQFGSGTTLTIGRYKNQVTPLTYYRPDTDVYYSLPWYDDGNYVEDGFKLQTKLGSVKTTLFGGAKNSAVLNETGTAFNRPEVGALYGPRVAGYNVMNGNNQLIGTSFGKPVGLPFRGGILADQNVGLNVKIPLFKYGEIGLTLIDFSNSADKPATVDVPFGNVVVYGANYKLNPIGRLRISGEAAKSVTQFSFDKGDGLPNDDNNAYTLNMSFNTGPVKISGGYQYIDPRFGAPGYWNKIGNWYNPTNIQGPFARVGYKFCDKLSFNIGGDRYDGARNRLGFTKGSCITRGLAGVLYNPCKHLSLTSDYEGVFYSISPSVSASGVRSSPIEQYITLGAGLNLSGNTVLKLGYQIGSTSNTNRAFGIDKSNFNTFTGQVAVKF